ENWVTTELNKIPPYIEKYEVWLNSGEDASKLLSDQDLAEALTWSENQDINESEKRFLELSEIAAKRKAQIARQGEAYQLAEKQLTRSKREMNNCPEFPSWVQERQYLSWDFYPNPDKFESVN
ncbi:MAG: hypothetical protein ACKO90_19100, partial [Microcystis panniformis]